MTPEQKKYLEKAHFAYRNLFVDYWDLPTNSVCQELEGLTREEESIFASSIPPPIWPINPYKPANSKPRKLGYRGTPCCIRKRPRKTKSRPKTTPPTTPSSSDKSI